jgi:hypothetical protein
VNSYPDTFRLLPYLAHDEESVDPLGDYAEAYWLPILHPTAYLLGRRLVKLGVRARITEGQTLLLNGIDLACAIGVAARTDDPGARPSIKVYLRAMRRMERYRLIRMRGASVEVRMRWPRLHHGLLSALPEKMQLAEHDYWIGELAVAPAGIAPDFIER